MLQFPTNVYPHNVTIDFERPISFTFNGDYLNTITMYYFDNETNETVTWSYLANEDLKAIWYNGDTVSVGGSDSTESFQVGKDYKMQMVLTQSREDGSSNIYDMYLLRGKIQEDVQEDSTSLKIRPNISAIYEFNNTDCREPLVYFGHIAAGIQIRIGSESREIIAYYPLTGEVIVDSPFSQPITENTTYKLYSNYLVTPFYYFKCNSKPEVSVTAKVSSYGIECGVNYSQAENVMVKFCQFTVYKFDGVYRFLSRSEKIYSNNATYTIIDDCVGQEYKIVCEVTTQGDVVMAGETVYSVPNNTTPSIQSCDVSALSTSNVTSLFIEHTSDEQLDDFRGMLMASQIFRHDLKSDKIAFLGFTVGSNFTDHTVSNQGEYQYIIATTGFDFTEEDRTYRKLTYTTNPVITDFSGWTITDVHETDKDFCGVPILQVGDTWKFVGNIDNTTVTQNTDKTLHVGHGQYPVVSESNTDYMTGTLSAMLGQIQCSFSNYKLQLVDDIELVKSWRKFITQHCKFILKSQKGDVWLVVITESPTTEYDESSRTLTTRFTFSWAECGNVDDYLYVNEKELNSLNVLF